MRFLVRAAQYFYVSVAVPLSPIIMYLKGMIFLTANATAVWCQIPVTTVSSVVLGAFIL